MLEGVGEVALDEDRDEEDTTDDGDEDDEDEEECSLVLVEVDGSPNFTSVVGADFGSTGGFLNPLSEKEEELRSREPILL